MRTKILLIITLLFFQVHFFFSQSISVELSVTWGKGNDIFEQDSMEFIPYLHITYRNNSNINYYFLKISESRDGLPMMPWCASIHSFSFDDYIKSRDDYGRKAKNHGNYSNQNYLVRIGGMPLFSSGWYVHQASKDYDNENEIDCINSDLADIYEYLFRKNGSDYVDKNIYFSPSNITHEGILSVVKDQFVFLKPSEIFIDTYNLIGFKLIEGCFTFIINQNFINEYVLMQPIWDDNQSYWVEQKMKLPINVDKYHLYSGPFYTNSIKVNFSNSSYPF